MKYRIIDTHVHTWDLSRNRYSWLDGNQSKLNRTYLLDELEPERVASGVTGGVLVQAANTYGDSDFMLGLCNDLSWLKGAVCWLPLMKPHETEHVLIGKYMKNPYFKGIRHLIHDEPDPTWLLQETVIESLTILAKNNIPYDLVGTTTSHIMTALRVAEKIPTLRMIFDHLNQPAPGQWSELMKEASKHDNFYVKISGQGTVTKRSEGDWDKSHIRPGVEFCLTNFGVDRTLCGGDWPVSLLAGGYSYTWNVYTSLLEELLDEQALDKVLYSNAVSFYQI